MFRRIWILSLIIGLSFATGCSTNREVSLAKDSTKAVTETKKADKIMVYVCGQVNQPGVYKLSADDRVVAAIDAAKGPTAKAALEQINQAEKMKDGQQIYIPSKKEAKKAESIPSKEETPEDSSSGDKINLNTATKDELMELNGVGESRAQDILSYREEHGKFSKIKDIMNVQGIKDGIFNKIKDKITV